ncbi:MAG: M20/M25/M40 family metallo-hydrolase [Elusimicrobia bacterium]|nr:M20/M25/M40 family metallo-hydrolase [Elusimicrobiota bacterium]
MKSRALSLLILAASVPASAQMRVSLEMPSAPSARAVMPLSALTAVPTVAAIPAPLAALPVAAAPLSAAPALRAVPAAAAPSASPLDAAKHLGASLSAASPLDAAPALSSAFDGGSAASDGPVRVPAAPTSGPDAFALRARELFENVRLAEARHSGGPHSDAVATDDEMRGRMERLPTTNPEREKYIQELFKLAGAKPEDIVVQDVGRGRHNFIVTKKGKSDRVIVIGGHHDKVREGAGSIDNGTGSTMVANLYQALRDQDTDATIVFIAFGREEEGLLGSQAYLDSLTDAQKSKIDAMVNLDTLAVNGTFSWKNNSTRALLDRVKQVAADTHHDLTEAHLDGGDADSSSFRQAGIPAITIYGASEDVIFDIIHSGRDTMGAFDLAHYRNAYLLTLEFLKSLDKKKLGPVGEGNV